MSTPNMNKLVEIHAKAAMKALEGFLGRPVDLVESLFLVPRFIQALSIFSAEVLPTEAVRTEKRKELADNPETSMILLACEARGATIGELRAFKGTREHCLHHLEDPDLPKAAREVYEHCVEWTDEKIEPLDERLAGPKLDG